MKNVFRGFSSIPDKSGWYTVMKILSLASRVDSIIYKIYNIYVYINALPASFQCFVLRNVFEEQKKNIYDL